ncbi:MAG: ribosomal protein L11 methyltransferase [Loktanella salsilacus]|jgi:ribosomal protein L11 methyltransferase|uniref:50S ribosomal protein L11 methyltransferase n=1 Tax=Loktanella salsilacus TaxID=195913 RepID=UPI0020B63DE0|nr:50S ribosomal protein L11 methyltransferase [Loktanella salsilacus]UTH47729.1 50S ribosomal protein L11 methyltransferase [Loktanella salsilacus]
MTTFTALTTTMGRSTAEGLALALEALEPEPTGIGVFEVEDGSGLFEVAAYFTDEPDRAGLAVLAMVHGVQDFNVSDVPDEDWVAKVRRDLPPVDAGRFFVYGSHDADKVPAGKVPLLIEAAMAFGTGHHGTTLGCLRAFDRMVDAGFVPQNAVDIGCGTAVLAMAAAHISPNVVLASDIDPTAVEVAAANVAANNLTGRVDCLIAAGFDAPALAKAAPFDLVFANILKGPLIAIAEDMAKATQPGGTAILSGILNEQADAVVEVYARAGFNETRRDSIVDWTTLTLTKFD